MFLHSGEDVGNGSIELGVADGPVCVLINARERQEIDDQLTLDRRPLHLEARLAPGEIVCHNRWREDTQKKKEPRTRRDHRTLTRFAGSFHHEATKITKDTKNHLSNSSTTEDAERLYRVASRLAKPAGKETA